MTRLFRWKLFVLLVCACRTLVAAAETYPSFVLQAKISAARCTLSINDMPVIETDANPPATQSADRGTPLNLLVHEGENQVKISWKSSDGKPPTPGQVVISVVQHDMVNKDQPPVKETELLKYEAARTAHETRLSDNSVIYRATFKIPTFAVKKLPWADAQDVLMTDSRATDARNLIFQLVEGYRTKSIERVLQILSAKDNHYAQANYRSAEEIAKTHRELIRRYVHDRFFKIETTDPQSMEITQVNQLNVYRITSTSEKPLLRAKFNGGVLTVNEYYIAFIGDRWVIVR